MTLTLYNSLGQVTAPINAPALGSTPFSSGTSLTISALGSDVLVQCTTTAGSSYTLTIPTSIGSLFKIIVADYGTVATGNITNCYFLNGNLIGSLPSWAVSMT